ncbi:MAG: hypothetical protein QT05_C0047G0045 [archaeon GW2011_AR13]|nr:MAG: hypothetical protein QT05_C0047G0045 [archaeon GW2011_AR13]
MWEIKIQIKKFRGFVKIFIRFFIHKVSCEVTKRSGALNSREELGDFHVASTKVQRDATFQYFEEIQKEPEGSF